MEKSKEKQATISPESRYQAYGSGTRGTPYHHYAYRTEQTYCQWIVRYIDHSGGKTHPNLLGAKVERYLSHLATEGKVSASTQRQALNALVFLYHDVLYQPLDGEIPVHSKRRQRPLTASLRQRFSAYLRL